MQEVGLQPALEEQQRVVREQGPEINQEVLNSMDVLQRNITEALRINPPLIMLMRQVKKSFAVTTSTGKTFVVPKVGAQLGLHLRFARRPKVVFCHSWQQPVQLMF